MGDRFFYLPFVAILPPLVALASRLQNRRVLLAAGCAMALLLAAGTLRQQENWATPEMMWANTLRHAPQNGLANGAMADVKLGRAERLFGSMGVSLNDPAVQALLREALACADRALVADPNDARARFSRGTALLRLKRLPAAISDLQAALKIGAGPLTGQVKVFLGHAYAASGDFDRAVATYADALRDHPHEVNLPLRLQMGKALADAGRPDLAVRYFESACELAGDDPGPYTALGAALAAANQWDKALSAYARARQLLRMDATDSSELDLILIRCHLELGQADEADRLLKPLQVIPTQAREREIDRAGVAALRSKVAEAFEILAALVASDPAARSTIAHRHFLARLHTDPRWSRVASTQPASQPAG